MDEIDFWMLQLTLVTTEWKVDIDLQNDTHRHLSHLVGLYPGDAISNFNSILQLHTLDTAQVNADIRRYIHETLLSKSGSTSWYSADDVEALVTLSEGLFIFASTVMAYVLDRTTSKARSERLRKASSAAHASMVVTAPLDRVYEFILIEAARSDKIDTDRTTDRCITHTVKSQNPAGAHRLKNTLNAESSNFERLITIQLIVWSSGVK